MTSITWALSPAKLNLFLHINGRYENGYHQLQSLFQLLDVGDRVGIELSNDGKVSLATQLPDVAEQDNLAYRAAMALKPYAQSRNKTVVNDKAKVEAQAGCIIHLEKHLPMGGGIGGGSSNAAAVLVMLNRLWQCELREDQLADIGLTLGADVPIFVRGRSAFAEGVGEKLVPYNTPSAFFLVATPKVHVSTASIFRHPDLPRNTPKINFADYSFENTHNDCETLVCKLHPDVANLLQWLVNYAPSRMTGTGASVFAVFAAKEDAQLVLEKLPEHYSGFIAQGVNRSGLHLDLGL